MKHCEDDRMDYVLRRTQLALGRLLRSNSPEEKSRICRWLLAWQRKLARLLSSRLP